VLRSSKPRLEAPAQEASGGFVGNAAGLSYEQGRLGPPLSQGGDGTAEARYVESVALVARQFARLNEFAFERAAWDLLITYLPFPDEALHRWAGALDPSLPGHDPELARRIRPYMDRVLAIVDGYVGQVADRAGRDAIIAVASDHGMSSANRHLKPNVVLAQAGLLALDAAGRIDLARTRAVYFPGNSGYVVINRRGRPEGIVPPEEEEEVRRRVVAALTAFKDPATGRSLGISVIDVRTPPAGPQLGGPQAGDLFIEVGTTGIALSGRATGEALEARRPEGTHYQKPGDRRMLGSFVIAGPGVAAGADLGVIQQVDIAPTLAALLGMDPLAHAVGKPIPAAMAHKP
jgi:predicted AlkP superfamily phosphohydrolase/phosphomutase